MTTPAKKSVSTRRSGRAHVPSSRAEQYISERKSERPAFPSLNDEIQVKWVVNGISIWWPATVVTIQPPGARSRKCNAQLLYRKFQQYEAVLHAVVFSGSKERFVASIDSDSGESGAPSSWLYSDEDGSEIEDLLDREYEQVTQSPSDRNESIVHGKGRQHSQQQLKLSKSIRKRLSTRKEQSNIGSLAGPSSAVLKRTSYERANDDVKPDEIVATQEHNNHPSYTPTKYCAVPVDANEAVAPGKHSSELHVRLQLIERQLQKVNPERPVSSTSASTLSVLSSLRWAFLRSLEKPLRNNHYPSLSKHGLARLELSVSTHCDYYTFREIASMLATEHKFAADEPNKSRVGFTPAFHTTQSGSSASNDLNIIFSCLSDLTSFLRIRDDKDFESILTKEVVNDTSTMLRIVGTFTIATEDTVAKSEGRHVVTTVHQTSTSSKSTTSVSVSSESLSTIRIFVGTSPVSFTSVSRPEFVFPDQKDSEGNVYRSTVFEQDCKHFCLNKKCYRTQWKPKHIDCDLSVNSTFHLDGTIENGQLDKYFLLNWSRQQAPSQVKWTKDIQDVGNNTPGQLRLLVPTIFLTSNHNVRCLVSMFDKHIETFMKIRSKLHNSSGFR